MMCYPVLSFHSWSYGNVLQENGLAVRASGYGRADEIDVDHCRPGQRIESGIVPVRAPPPRSGLDGGAYRAEKSRMASGAVKPL